MHFWNIFQPWSTRPWICLAGKTNTLKIVKLKWYYMLVIQIAGRLEVMLVTFYQANCKISNTWVKDILSIEN